MSTAIPDHLDAGKAQGLIENEVIAQYELGAKRHGYLVPAQGSVEVNGVRILTRDGAAISNEPVLEIKALEDSEIVLVDAA